MTLTREQKVLGYVFGVIQRLADLGILSRPERITARGTAVFDQVLASGFRPTEDEILMALTAAQRKKVLKFRNDIDRDMVKTLVVEYRPPTPH